VNRRTTLLLVLPALLLAIFAPYSDLADNTTSAFKQAAADTIVSATMTVIATCATFISILLNPVALLARGLSTLAERINDWRIQLVNATLLPLICVKNFNRTFVV